MEKHKIYMPLLQSYIKAVMVRNCCTKVSLMISQRVDTGHIFGLADWKIRSHVNGSMTRLFKEST